MVGISTKAKSASATSLKLLEYETYGDMKASYF